MASETKFKAYFAELDKLVGKDDKSYERAVSDFAYTVRSTTAVLAEDLLYAIKNDVGTRSELELNADALELLGYVSNIRTLAGWKAIFTVLQSNSMAPSSNPVKQRITLLIGLIAEAMKVIPD